MSVVKNSLPRSLSLKSRKEISDLLANGQRSSYRYFTLVWQPDEDFKYAVLLSRRHGPAHRRNRLKRLFREAIRLSRKRLGQTGRVVLLPRRQDREPEFGQLRADVSRVFKRLNRE